MKRRKNRAQEMLKILETSFPDGVATRDIACQLFAGESPRERERVYRLARVLREEGHPVYGLGGLYYICTPEKLRLVGEQKAARLFGAISGIDFLFGKAFDMMESMSERERKSLVLAFTNMRFEIKQSLLKFVGNF